MSIDRDELRKLAMGAGHVGATVHLTPETALALLDQLDQAEAQLRAVRQVLDQHRDQTADGLWIDIDDQIPHGDLGNPDQNCGKGVCALGDGHPGPCRC